MDLQQLEKRIIYLKGVQNGILQGSNPNVSKYKMQLDFEINNLEKQFQNQQNQQSQQNQQNKSNDVNKSTIQNILFASKNVSKERVTPTPIQTQPQNQSISESSSSSNDRIQFQEVSKKINQLKEQIFQNNNQIQLLNRNKTYQNTLRVQNIFKQNNIIYLQIQKYQSLYDLLNLKINHPALYKSKYGEENSEEDKVKVHIESSPALLASAPKSILKSSEKKIIKPSKHIEINTAKNIVHEEIQPPKINKPIQFVKKSSNIDKNISIENKREKEDEKSQNDAELMKEFQSTLGALQKLLI